MDYARVSSNTSVWSSLAPKSSANRHVIKNITLCDTILDPSPFSPRWSVFVRVLKGSFIIISETSCLQSLLVRGKDRAGDIYHRCREYINNNQQPECCCVNVVYTDVWKLITALHKWIDWVAYTLPYTRGDISYHPLVERWRQTNQTNQTKNTIP